MTMGVPDEIFELEDDLYDALSTPNEGSDSVGGRNRLPAGGAFAICLAYLL